MMEQYVVTSKTKELVFFKRVNEESDSELFVTKKFLRKLLKNSCKYTCITCEQIVSIEYAKKDDPYPISFNGIINHDIND